MNDASTVLPRIRVLWLIVLVVTGLVPASTKAEASWFIDRDRFHISVHGQSACLDCHEDVAARDLHPNPGKVGKGLSDFFKTDQCLSCHDDIEGGLERGVHGTVRVKNPQEYGRCIQCHDPHYQLPLDQTLRKGFDPARPIQEQCGICHEKQQALPPPSGPDRECLTCHAAISLNDPAGAEKMGQFCFYCHGKGETRAQKMTADKVSPMVATEYSSTTHSGVSCTVCHPEAAQFGHDTQKTGRCSSCHAPHDEKVAHDAHVLVSCEACHLGGITPVRDPRTSMVLGKRTYEPEKVSRIHYMVWGEDGESCRRCHFPGNQVGAAAVALPAKGILCLPCHAATFSIGDGITLTALILFILGCVGLISPWLSASITGRGKASSRTGSPGVPHTGQKWPWSSRVLIIARAVVLDVLLQRRLYRQSRTRWIIHSLIFVPIVFRFLWGMVALIGSLWNPGWAWVWPMLDKNFPATAFLFDLTGMMIIVGILLALVRWAVGRSRRLPGLERQDPWALGLLGLLIVIGFFLEGMRIAMTGHPPGSAGAFLGYRISLFFSDASGLTDLYGFLWYAHAVLTGAFVVYLPFSRMLHIIVAPLVLVVRALSDQAHERGVK